MIDVAIAWHQRYQVAVFARVDAFYDQMIETSSRYNKPPVVAPEPRVVTVLTRLEQVSSELTHILADISGS